MTAHESAVTVYPAKPGAFPPASFRDTTDALRYSREMVDLNVSGVCVCPAQSYIYYQRFLEGIPNGCT